MRKLLTALIGSAWLLASAVYAAEDYSKLGPTELVDAVAKGILKDLDTNREAYKKDPKMVQQLVDKHLLPNFDTDYSARLVLGKHWKTATPEQKERFVKAFYQSLLVNYGSALAEFKADNMRVLPSKVDPASDKATVRTEIIRSSGEAVPVNYTLHKTAEGRWKAWDLTIEGISFVKSLREDFGAEIEQKGIDAVIDRLSKGGKPRGGSASKSS
jgi:phospholipid transport system substrate-binding protein